MNTLTSTVSSATSKQSTSEQTREGSVAIVECGLEYVPEELKTAEMCAIAVGTTDASKQAREGDVVTLQQAIDKAHLGVNAFTSDELFDSMQMAFDKLHEAADVAVNEDKLLATLRQAIDQAREGRESSNSSKLFEDLRLAFEQAYVGFAKLTGDRKTAFEQACENLLPSCIIKKFASRLVSHQATMSQPVALPVVSRSVNPKKMDESFKPINMDVQYNSMFYDPIFAFHKGDRVLLTDITNIIDHCPTVFAQYNEAVENLRQCREVYKHRLSIDLASHNVERARRRLSPRIYIVERQLWDIVDRLSEIQYNKTKCENSREHRELLIQAMKCHIELISADRLQCVYVLTDEMRKACQDFTDALKHHRETSEKKDMMVKFVQEIVRRMITSEEGEKFSKIYYEYLRDVVKGMEVEQVRADISYLERDPFLEHDPFTKYGLVDSDLMKKLKTRPSTIESLVGLVLSPMEQDESHAYDVFRDASSTSARVDYMVAREKVHFVKKMIEYAQFTRMTSEQLVKEPFRGLTDPSKCVNPELLLVPQFKNEFDAIVSYIAGGRPHAANEFPKLMETISGEIARECKQYLADPTFEFDSAGFAGPFLRLCRAYGLGDGVHEKRPAFSVEDRKATVSFLSDDKTCVRRPIDDRRDRSRKMVVDHTKDKLASFRRSIELNGTKALGRDDMYWLADTLLEVCRSRRRYIDGIESMLAKVSTTTNDPALVWITSMLKRFCQSQRREAGEVDDVRIAETRWCFNMELISDSAKLRMISALDQLYSKHNDDMTFDDWLVNKSVS